MNREVGRCLGSGVVAEMDGLTARKLEARAPLIATFESTIQRDYGGGACLRSRFGSVSAILSGRAIVKAAGNTRSLHRAAHEYD
jgi:hypothetical protein